MTEILILKVTAKSSYGTKTIVKQVFEKILNQAGFGLVTIIQNSDY